MKIHIFSRKARSQERGAPPKQTKPTDPILKSYWLSLLSLMLCVTMFFGTTVAWFSDAVEVPYNRIDVGTLSVKLEYQKKPTTGGTGYVNLVNNSDEKIFDETIPWAPGYTAVREVRVTNAGTLNLRYMFTFQQGKTPEGVTPELGWTEKLAQCFEVYVKDGGFDGGSLPGSYSELMTSWTPVKNLDGNVANLAEIVAQKLTVNANTIAHKADSAAENPSHSFLIALHMKEDADFGMSGKKLPLGAYLVAYQDSTDIDDLGSRTPILFVQNAVELKKAVSSNSGFTIVLTENIVLDGDLSVEHPLQLDLSSHSLTLDSLTVTSDKGKFVIRDSTVVSTTPQAGTITGSVHVTNNGSLLVNGGILHNVQVTNGTLIMNGGVVDTTDSAADGITLNGTSKVELNYGYLKVKADSHSVYAQSGTGTVTTADTFHFVVGDATEAKYGAAAEAALTVNGKPVTAPAEP